MIDLQAARELKHAVMTGFDSGGMRAAEALLNSIEKEYGSLDGANPEPGPRTIAEWQRAIHEYAKDKGWWDKPRSIGDIFILFTSEVAEAYEEYRNGHALTETYFNPGLPDKPEGVPTELADVVIRVLDLCEWAGIDLQEVMRRKHEYNLTRAYRHGGKVT